ARRSHRQEIYGRAFKPGIRVAPHAGRARKNLDIRQGWQGDCRQRARRGGNPPRALRQAAQRRSYGFAGAGRGCVNIWAASAARHCRGKVMGMFRMTDIILVVAMVAATAFTYTTKHDAEAEFAKIRRLEATIRLEEEAIDVLKADWSLLTQPARWQKLAEIYFDDLQLVPVEPHQIAEFDELPERAMRIEELIGGPGDVTAATGSVDEITTSGVGQ